jgi:hypothetical protein
MRMLGKLGLAAAVLTLALMPATSEAATITLTPGDADFEGSLVSNCEPECVEEAFGLLAGSLDLLYKADVGGADSGSFADSYDTVFANTPSDPSDATITYILATPSISCPSCYLAVKDGNQEPSYYFFDISDWNGTDTIALLGFWPDQGAISHVAIWGDEEDGGGGDTVVPEPAALLLFGLGTLFVGRRARSRFAAR